MTRIFLAILLLSMPLAPMGWTGCTTPQQTTTLNTLGTLEAAATTGVDTYYALVIKGTISTNSMPTVSKAYNDFQAAMVLAVTLVQNNTNALAPANLVQEETDLINLINTAK
jgi:hypothetical protein